MQTFELDIAVTRGDATESVHRVHAAVVDVRGALVGKAREPETPTYWRSCAKLFQVMPLLETCIGMSGRTRNGSELRHLGTLRHAALRTEREQPRPARRLSRQ